MSTMVATFAAFLAVVLLLVAIAVISGYVLKGSCGGIASSGCACREAGKRPGSDCEKESPSEA